MIGSTDIVCAFVGREVVEQFADASPGGLDGALIGLAQQAFEFGEHLLDRVQIGRVGRQEEQPDAPP